MDEISDKTSQIRAKIKIVRSVKGLSQEKMAELIGIEQTTYSNWETGKIEMTLKNLQRVADALGVPIDDLWSSDQFQNKNYQAPEYLQRFVAEQSHEYTKKSKAMIPLSECEDIVNKLQQEIRKLEDQNWALTRSLNTLFDKQKLNPTP